MNASSQVTIVPLVGPFHTRFPQYNVVHVKALLQSLAPQALLLAPLQKGALDVPDWQSTSEIALPHTVVPWARRHQVPVHAIGVATGQPGGPGTAEDAAEFERFLSDFEAGRARLRQVQAALQPVKELLGRALDLGRIASQLLPAIATYQEVRLEQYGEGPGTDWLAERAGRMADSVLQLPYQHAALLVGVDDLAALQAALAGRVTVRLAGGSPATSDEARQRSLLDVAMRGEVEEPGTLLEQLRQIDSAESQYHQANLLLAHDHLVEALELLKRVAGGDFHEPYYLPGFVLARLGQLFDLDGDRDAAVRAYRGAMALDYAPPEAFEAASAGLQQPFTWPQPPEAPADEGGAPSGQ
jgi:hypothetical protein